MNLKTEFVRTSRNEFQSDEKLEWYIKTRELVGVNIVLRDVIFNEDGELYHSTQGGIHTTLPL